MLNPTKRSKAVLYIAILAFAVFSLVPYYWVLRTAFLTNMAAISLTSPVLPLPGTDAFSLQSFHFALDQYPLVKWFENSIFIAFGSTILALIFAIPGAYAFARLDFPGQKFLFYTAVFTIMFPWIVIIIPVYEVFYEVHLINTYAGMILAIGTFVMPQCIWLLQGFFRQGIPNNIEEAAKIDGLNELTAFIRIVLPLSMPAVAVTALFGFLSGWNNFLWIYLLANDEGKRTAIVAVYYLPRDGLPAAVELTHGVRDPSDRTTGNPVRGFAAVHRRRPRQYGLNVLLFVLSLALSGRRRFQHPPFGS